MSIPKNIDETFSMISGFMRKTESEIKQQFLSLKGAVSLGIKGHDDFENIYIPGSKKDKVLLVAHVDTVWIDKNINPVQKDQYIYSGNINRLGKDEIGEVGIGADDRAGVAMLWALRNMGHSILLTGAEETGAQGVKALFRHEDDSVIDEINDHQFAIEFDRHGSRDAVFYNVGTKIFKKFIQKNTFFTEERGSFTDICILCQKMCGVNFSVGYFNEHTNYEFMNMNTWTRNINEVHKLLSLDLPKFEITTND